MPYYGYSRQDKKAPRARADLGEARRRPALDGRRRARGLGRPAHRADPGILRLPRSITSRRSPILSDYLQDTLGLARGRLVVVAPDAGRIKTAEKLREALHADLAFLYKRRSRQEAHKIEEMAVVGEVDGRPCVLVDDMMDTAGTVAKGAAALAAQGAGPIFAAATHAVLSGKAAQHLEEAPIQEVVVTNTRPDPRGEAVRASSRCCRSRRSIASALRAVFEDELGLRDLPRREPALAAPEADGRPGRFPQVAGTICGRNPGGNPDMEQKLVAERRDGTGKSVTRKLRAAGKVPAVVYGHGMTPISVVVDSKELYHVMHTGAGANVLVDLVVDGEEHLALAREVQRNYVRGEVVHVDFLAIRRDQKVAIDVPVRVVGESPGVKQGGVVEHHLWDLHVECLPGDVPEAIEADISPIELGSSLHVSDLVVPSGVTMLTSPDEVVLSVVTPQIMKLEEAVPEEGEAVAEAAEGEEGAPAAAAEGGAPAEGGGES